MTGVALRLRSDFGFHRQKVKQVRKVTRLWKLF